MEQFVYTGRRRHYLDVQLLPGPAMASSILKMDKHCRPLALLLAALFCSLSLLRACSAAASVTAGAPDGSQLWGYVEVRPSKPTGTLTKKKIKLWRNKNSVENSCARGDSQAFLRAEANLFWWYYKSPQRVSAPSAAPWPTVLWLQGGPVLIRLMYIVVLSLENSGKMT